MEAFSLLKYWKGGGGTDPFLPSSRTPTTTILTATTADDEDNDDFFDLEFAVPEDDDKNDAEQEEDSDSESDDDDVVEEEEDEGEEDDPNREELGFTISTSVSSSSSSSTGNDRATASPSGSESLFFKGRLVVPNDDPASEPNSRPPPPSHQLPSLINKSATKFRVFLLGLKKPKVDAQTPQKQEDDVARSGKLLTLKLKVEEVPLVSLFSGSRNQSQTQGQSQTKTKKEAEAAPVCEENRRFSKEGVQRYLKKVKPLYVKVSKLRSSVAGAGEGTTPAVKMVERQVSLPLRVVYKHLGKSRSGGSSLGVSSPPGSDPSVTVAPAAVTVSNRRDDSLLQQQDGIHGAILHCKRSFNASRDSDASTLPRSSSDNKLTESQSRRPSGCHERIK